MAVTNATLLAKISALEARVTALAAQVKSDETSYNSKFSILNPITNSGSITFLNNIGQMSHLANTGTSYGTSGVGTVSGTVTAAEYNSLNTAYNNSIGSLNTFAGSFNTLLTRLQAENYMA